MSYTSFDYALMAARLIVVNEKLRAGRKQLRQYRADLLKMTLDDKDLAAASERLTKLTREIYALDCQKIDMENVMRCDAYRAAIAAHGM
jgi:hypothetical protein